jgi:hypothetical protein
VPKYTAAERKVVKNIVATLSIKRIPDNDIIENIFEQTGKTLSQSGLFPVRQQIKKESAKWYSQLRESEYEYIHESKELIREIEFLQRKHYEIIDSNPNNATVQQVSLAALHKLNVTLSNYYDVAPAIGDTQRQLQVTGNSIQEDQDQARRMFKIEGCTWPMTAVILSVITSAGIVFVFGVLLLCDRIGVLIQNVQAG